MRDRRKVRTTIESEGLSFAAGNCENGVAFVEREDGLFVTLNKLENLTQLVSTADGGLIAVGEIGGVAGAMKLDACCKELMWNRYVELNAVRSVCKHNGHIALLGLKVGTQAPCVYIVDGELDIVKTFVVNMTRGRHTVLSSIISSDDVIYVGGMSCSIGGRFVGEIGAVDVDGREYTSRYFGLKDRDCNVVQMSYDKHTNEVRAIMLSGNGDHTLESSVLRLDEKLDIVRVLK